MDLSRRELSIFWPLLFAAGAAGAQTAPLPSECYSFESLPVKVNPTTHAESRQVFRGTTHDGFPLDLHITTMPPGQSPHPPHHHVHEEIMLVQTGRIEMTISGKTCVAGPGSVVFVHSNEEHGLKSVGDVPAQYFVLATGNQTAS